MSNRLGRALRGLSFACLWFLALPALAQIRNEGAIPDGRGGVGVLAAGMEHTCGLRQDGTASCWGSDYDGKATPPTGAFIELSAAFDHTCGLRGDGSVVCWGAGYTAREGEPQPPPPPEMSGRFTALASGITLTCGLRARTVPWEYPEGNVACWAPYGSPLPSPPPGDFAALSVGDQFACGLRADGRVECWGIDQAVVPQDVFIAVSAGARHACGLRADGSVQCWGDNWAGQATPPAELFTAISAGAFNTCGLRTDGRVQCWGENWGGQSTPPEEPFVAISAGAHHACGVRTDGTVACWGNVNWGNYYGMPPRPFEGVFGVGQLAAGDWHHCQVTPEGRLSCWGGITSDPAPWARFTAAASGEGSTCARNEGGRLECFGNTGNIGEGLPFEPLRQFDVGYEHGCGVLALDGHAQCWGRETNGKTLAPEGLFRNLSAGLVHSCGVVADGTGECWGYNGDGQSTVPPLPPERRFLTVQAGERHSCGLDSDLHIKCWGLSPPPVDPNDPYNPDPQYLPEFATFRALSVGSDNSCAIRTDGRLLCWGAEWYGQLQVPEGTFVAVSTGRNHSCAIRTDGRRECWGMPGMSPKLSLGPDRLPGVRPNQQVYFNFDLRSEDGWSYQVRDPHYAIVAGTLPLGFHLFPDGSLRGSWHETGRYPITIEGRDRNGFAVRRDYVLAIDDTPPVVAPTLTGTLGENGWYTSPVSVEWSVTDPDSDINWSYCEPTWVSHETAGAHVFCDAESAGGMSHQELEIKVDLVAPAQPVVNATINGTDASFEFVSNDAMSGVDHYYCSVDGGFYNLCTSPLQLQVAQGAHDLRVLAVDGAGFHGEDTQYKWVTDATPPVITETVDGIRGLNGWYMSDVQISWEVADPETPVSATTGCNTVTVTTQSPGAGFICSATSLGGTASKEVVVKVDKEAPETLLQSAPDAQTNRTTATFTFTGQDSLSGVGSFVCILDGGAPTICTSPYTRSVGDGNHTFVVRAYDQAGLRDLTPVTYSWLVDTTPPVVTPSTTGIQGNNGWFVGDVQISWAVGESQQTLLSTTGCGAATLTTDSPGAGFTCTATSVGGTTTRTATVKRDTVAPDTTLTATPAGDTDRTDIAIAFAGSDATSGVVGYECSVDGAAFAACASPWASTVAVGHHRFEVRAVDAAGNRDATPAVHAWSVDQTPPQIFPQVSGTVAGGTWGTGTDHWYVGDVSIAWVVGEVGSSVTNRTGCNSVTLRTDSNAATFTCTATSAGGTSSETVTVRRDSTAPTLAITSAPDAPFNPSQVEFTFAGSDIGSGVTGYKCSVDGASFVACQSPLSLSVGAGHHNLRVYAVDAVGLTSAVASHDWEVDGSAPLVSRTLTGNKTDLDWYTTDVHIEWQVSDPESPITGRTGCDPVDLVTDTAGTHYLCTATSYGGQTGSGAVIKRDTTPPQTTLTATPPAFDTQRQASLAFTGDDATAGVRSYECSLDGQAFEQCSSPYAYAVGNGPHSFQVRAVDNAYHRDPTPAQYSWVVDDTPPTIQPVVSGTLGSNGWYTSDVQIAWTVSDADSPASGNGCNTVTLTTDTIGASFTCTAASAGGTATRTVTIKRDATAPVVTAAATTAPNAAGWYRGDVTVGFTCSDASSGVVSCPAAQVLGGEGSAIASSVRTVTDAAGNSATSNAVTVNIDRTAPTLAPTVTPATLLLNAVTTANPNASDALSGIALKQCDALATGTVGNKSVTCTATDAAGNSASASGTYRVVYGFNGFSSPVQNPPVLNVFRAGRSIPLRWRVVDAQGAPVANLTSAAVAAVAITCPSATENRISVYGGSNGQLQNLGNGYYGLDWAVATSLRNACRRLELNLGDGVLRPAQFKFN